TKRESVIVKRVTANAIGSVQRGKGWSGVHENPQGAESDHLVLERLQVHGTPRDLSQSGALRALRLLQRHEVFLAVGLAVPFDPSSEHPARAEVNCWACGENHWLYLREDRFICHMCL